MEGPHSGTGPLGTATFIGRLSVAFGEEAALDVVPGDARHELRVAPVTAP